MKQKIGVLGMKSMGNGIILTMLEQAIGAVNSFRPMSQPKVDALLTKTSEAAAGGEFESFKTTSIFDSTATHPEWLGEESARELMQA